MLFTKTLALFATLAAASTKATDATTNSDYEYLVVGSGAGGGPVAARLAMAGYKTLLIEAGDDQGNNDNYTVPAYSALSSEDGALAWNFFVRHYADDKRQARNYKTSYETPDGQIYTGLNPPAGSKMLGTLYPRTGTLGGCTAHNALIGIYPHQSDFDRIASITNDDSWLNSNMRQYFARLENNHYLLPGAKGHGYKGWYHLDQAPLTIPLADPQLLSLFTGAALATGHIIRSVSDLVTVLLGDANRDDKSRDTNEAYYQVPISTKDHSRVGSREFVVAVRDAKNKDGSKKYPLDVKLNTHVTKITFDESGDEPRATGVEYLEGQYLYKASPRNKYAGKGTPGSVKASREVIISGGTYNSPQLLKLSGIGPKEELESLKIPVLVDLPGVGTNLQDHYEIAVQGKVPKNFAALEGCNFGYNGQEDPCLKRWKANFLGDRGTYASNGLGTAIFFKSSVSERNEWDNAILGGPINFRGYFPNYSFNITADHTMYTWAILKAHPRNRAGTVKLISSDPLTPPQVTYNYFDTGSGDSDKDLQALSEAVGMARKAFKSQLVPVKEVLPGAEIQSVGDIKQYAADTAWGHHASCTCPIGADDDPNAVLDSSFRVRGVRGLRVVDASVYPHIPGTFTAVSTYMVGEKAADVIIAQRE